MFIPQGFPERHIGPSSESCRDMLDALGCASLDALVDEAVPGSIRLENAIELPDRSSETAALAELRDLMARNRVRKSFIGQGYHGTVTPAVIQRNILENPGWYTAYTPYQAEIAQGRLEALLNFQSMVVDLTGMDVANASLLDEGTAAAEAMTMAQAAVPRATTFFADRNCHPQTLDVLRTRAEAAGVHLEIGDWQNFAPVEGELSGALVQYPDTLGKLHDYEQFASTVHEAGGLLVVAADPLALTLLKEPGAFGADLCVGSTQRFGVPLGFGGPHAAYLACRDALKRKLPGRLVGVSVDSDGKRAYRLALQTREQHIRRDKATSNICTAQVLLAVMASMYAVYHGPEGLREIAGRIHGLTGRLVRALREQGVACEGETFFDTVTFTLEENREDFVRAASDKGYNLRLFEDGRVGVSLDETAGAEDVRNLLGCLGLVDGQEADRGIPDELSRTTPYLDSEVFHLYHSETEMMRYLRRLEGKDQALNESMISLGSCTMKLNAASEMMPVTWPEVGGIHPFAPAEQTTGYRAMLSSLEEWLARITEFAAVSLQPNAGSQGEYAGLLAIRSYHHDRGEAHRDICLIPVSAHGTNPASAVMAGFRVVAVKCDEDGNIDVEDLQSKCERHSGELGALMVTYPSTHGVFEEGILDVCDTVHRHGGQVYMDGANMNAQVGLCSPGGIGADVCHLNLHKTFCIPHGGGGPGVGPIGVAKHLVEYLPGHAELSRRDGAISAAPWGSASINVISWMYIRMMGVDGLTAATKVALLNANYVAHRLKDHFPVLYTGSQGRVAHECIIDLRPVQKESGVTVEDVAKRLIDYGFHAPTMSWPVAGTLMIEPTESESKEELDRFCEAMIAIHGEIQEVITGEADSEDNVVRRAPHTAEVVAADGWDRPYSRERAAFPVARLREHKFWPSVGRVDNVHGDRNLVCTCEGMEAYDSD
ncbi:MAG: glycine dehydrogenase (aminomethyl-transferring) [Roseibacillus sp.]|nr:glycine dehydrogenase (aminomethyl-transferring) [Roseibacillus sp.]